MTSKIFKYPIEVTDTQTIKLPAGSRILSVMNQYEKIVLYALVSDNEKDTKEVSIRIVGTGHVIDFFIPALEFGGGYTFLGTVSLHDGRLMFHVFYKKGDLE
jgi:hypothetical protein